MSNIVKCRSISRSVRHLIDFPPHCRIVGGTPTYVGFLFFTKEEIAMCGIVGIVSDSRGPEKALRCLKRLEYRGYDSAGIAGVNKGCALERHRALGKLSALRQQLKTEPFAFDSGAFIAHTRWATHGHPSEQNAHPHISGDIAVVHNGIIENHEDLRALLTESGYVFVSQTDTEVIAHLIHLTRTEEPTLDLRATVTHVLACLSGTYAIAVISEREPEHLIVARSHSPLVIGIGTNEHLVASDPYAFAQRTRQYVVLEDGDVADLSRDRYTIFNKHGETVYRKEMVYNQDSACTKGLYRHFMAKEIHEQPIAMQNTLTGRIVQGHIAPDIFGHGTDRLFREVKNVHIVACGTSHHASRVARYWFRQLGIECDVDVASEYRYSDTLVRNGTLFVWISQSGETADTLAALNKAKELGYLSTLGICNTDESSLVRESDHTFMTYAGREQSVASTKAFTTQLVALRLLSLAIAHAQGSYTKEDGSVRDLMQLPILAERMLALEDTVAQVADLFTDTRDAFFIGRGEQYPVALEGALKLKEVSYIHAEGYPAGELKHGPIALVDRHMQIVCMLAHDHLMDKVLSNIEEVRARQGSVIVFVEEGVPEIPNGRVRTVRLPALPRSIAPILTVIPLQLLAYHVAVKRGTDVDQPRNLAKSVTVE